MKPAILSPLEAGTVFRSSKLEDFESRVQSFFQDDAELQLLLAKIADETSRLEEISKCQEVAYTSLCLILQSDISSLLRSSLHNYDQRSQSVQETSESPWWADGEYDRLRAEK